MIKLINNWILIFYSNISHLIKNLGLLKVDLKLGVLLFSKFDDMTK